MSMGKVRGSEMKQLTIELSDEIFKELQKTCIVNTCTMEEAILLLLKRYYFNREE